MSTGNMPLIRRARASDVPEMHRLQQRGFEEEGRRCGTREIPPLQEPASSIAAHVESQIALVAEEDGTILGCIRGIVEGRVCTVRALVVDPSRHGGGLGSALLVALEAELRGIDRVVLTTNTVMEKNVRFYDRHGYSVFEHTSPLPGVRLAQMSKALT